MRALGMYSSFRGNRDALTHNKWITESPGNVQAKSLIRFLMALAMHSR